MPEVTEAPVINAIGKSELNDFMLIHWSWEDQTNLTIQSKGVKNPIGLKSKKRLNQIWPSHNGHALAPKDISDLMRHFNSKIDNIEILINNSGRTISTSFKSYINQVSDLLEGRYNLIGYRSLRSSMPQDLVNALADIPGIIVPSERLGALAETPGFGTFEAAKDIPIARLQGGRRLLGEHSKNSRLQPYHVRAGKRPFPPVEDVRRLPSMPRAAGSAAGGRVGGAPARDAAMDAEEFIGVVGL